MARGTDTFAAGDILVAYIDYDTFAGTISPVGVMIEVQFDN